MIHLKDRPIWRLILRITNILLLSNRREAPSLPSSHWFPWLQVEEEQANTWISNSFHSSHSHSLDNHPPGPYGTHTSATGHLPVEHGSLVGHQVSPFPAVLTFPTQLPGGHNQITWHCLRVEQWQAIVKNSGEAVLETPIPQSEITSSGLGG